MNSRGDQKARNTLQYFGIRNLSIVEPGRIYQNDVLTVDLEYRAAGNKPCA
jgi:hypothetical protein